MMKVVQLLRGPVFNDTGLEFHQDGFLVSDFQRMAGDFSKTWISLADWFFFGSGFGFGFSQSGFRGSVFFGSGFGFCFSVRI